MYIVRMFDKEEMAKGYLTNDGEFGIKDEATEFETENEAQEAIDNFLDELDSDSSGIYSYKIKAI